MEIITDQEIEKIKKSILINEIVCLESPTGTGKTTLLPPAFARCKAKVYCVQPNTSSILSIAEYVSTKNKDIKVGYFINENEKKINEYTQIIYCSSSYVKNIFMKNYKKQTSDFCSILMLDEIHSGTMDYDIIISLWLDMYSRKITLPKLILSSAIMNMSYLPFDISDKTITLKKKNNYDIIYHDKFFKISETTSMYNEMLDVIFKLHVNEKIKEFSTWIVFLSSNKDIYKFMNLIKKSSLSFPDLEYSNAPRSLNRKGIRKLLLITNSFETSITINHVDGVFDSMLETVDIINTTGSSKSMINNISKSSAIQRAGRTGRHLKGFVYRMCTYEFYASLNTFRISELNRKSLCFLFIDLIKKNIDITSLFKYRLDIERIDQFKRELVDLKICKSVDNKLSIISQEKAEFILRFKFLGIYNSLLLYFWKQKKLPLFPLIVFFSIINLKEPLLYYGNERNNISDNFKSKDIITTYLKIWDLFSVDIQTLNPDKNIVYNWCKTNRINNNTMNNLIQNVKEYYEIFNKSLVFEIARFTPDNVIKEIKDIILNENLVIFEKHKLKMFYKNKYNEFYKLDTIKHYIPNLNIESDKISVFNTVSEIDNENRHTGKNFITMFLPLD